VCAAVTFAVARILNANVFGDTTKQDLSTWFIDDRGLHISDAAGRVHMVFT
jgi:hypothetical protein